MNEKVSEIMKKFIKDVADFSSETTSVVGLYQPETPKTLIKSSDKQTEE